jgi:hypothetical protein
MANIVYPWNPFQDNINCRITDETIRAGDFTAGRVEFVPRGAPFFSRNFELYRQGSVEPLKLGYDYCFAHAFGKFILGYNRNAFGSVIMLRPMAGDVLLPKYDTLGGPLTLDDVAFATFVANIVNAPRVADWADLDGPTIPLEFPSDPHEHPANQTYDYLEMMDQLKSLILAVTDNAQGVTLKSLLEEHIGKELIEAHAASAADIGLPLTPNMQAAMRADLAGNSANLLVTVDVLKEAFRKLAAGTLNIGESEPTDPGTGEPGAPGAPLEIVVSPMVKQNTSGNTLIVRGASNGADGVTYKLTQSGDTRVTFNKTQGIIEGEVIVFSTPTVEANTPVTITAIAVAVSGAVSIGKDAQVTVLYHQPPSPPTILNAPSEAYKGSTGNKLMFGGSIASDNASVTYSVTQSGDVPVTFSKTQGILAGEVITFDVPEDFPVSTDLTISAVAVDSMGSASQQKTGVVRLSLIPSIPGVAFGGGFYMGRMLINGFVYAVVQAPKASGEFPIPITNEVAAAWAGMQTIGGHDDWILPTWNMSDIIYRVCKPDTTQNAPTYASPYNDINGINPESIPQGKQYTYTDPAQTSLEMFKAGGSEAFVPRGYGMCYWTSSVDGRYVNGRYFARAMNNGNSNTDWSGLGIARVVRLVLLGAHLPPTAPTVNIDPVVPQDTVGNVLTLTGSASENGATLTYSLSQSGPVRVTFSKTSGIAEGEVVTYTVPKASADTPIQISATAVDSQNKVSEARTVTLTITPNLSDGAQYGGGTFIGIITGDFKRYGLIVSPKAQGQGVAQFFPSSSWNYGAVSTWNGLANTESWSSYSNNSVPNSAAAIVRRLRIGGYHDWAIPADDQLDLMYRKGKPRSTDLNNTAFGINPSITPPGTNYTATVPGQTTLEKFKYGQSESFSQEFPVGSGSTMAGFFSSTSKNIVTPLAYYKDFFTGEIGSRAQSNTFPYRAVRMVEMPAPPAN